MFTTIITVIVTIVLTVWIARNFKKWTVQYFSGGMVASLSMHRMIYTAEMHKETTNAFVKYPTIMSKLLPNTHVVGDTVFALDQYGEIISIAQEGVSPLMRMDDDISLTYDEDLNGQERVYIRYMYGLRFNATRLYEYFKTKYGHDGWVLASDSSSNTAVVEWQEDRLSIVRNFYQSGKIVRVRLSYDDKGWSAMII